MSFPLKTIFVLGCWITGSCPCFGQQITEGFDRVVPVGDGSRLGQCGQIAVRLAGGGAVTIGNSAALLGSPTDAAAALLTSAERLPQRRYQARLAVESVDYFNSTLDYIALAGLYDRDPRPGDSSTWEGSAVLEVGASTSEGLVVSYHDAQGLLHGWTGYGWVEGYFGPVLWPGPVSEFEILIERFTASIRVQVRSGGMAWIDTTAVPLTTLRGQGSLFFAAGDGRTDRSRGTMTVGLLELPEPSICGTADGGPTVDGGHDATAVDAASDLADAALVRDAGPTDGPVLADATGWDLAFEPRVPEQGGGGGCALGAERPLVWQWLWLWGLLMLRRCVRSRRRTG